MVRYGTVRYGTVRTALTEPAVAAGRRYRKLLESIRTTAPCMHAGDLVVRRSQGCKAHIPSPSQASCGYICL